MVGLAAQRGLLPVSVAAIEQAVRLNGANVAFNLTAFGLGRVSAVDPARLTGLLPARPAPLDQGLNALIERRAAHQMRFKREFVAELSANGFQTSDRFARYVNADAVAG